MKAASYDRVGPAADVLQVIDGPEPNPGSQEVRVRMYWSKAARPLAVWCSAVGESMNSVP